MEKIKLRNVEVYPFRSADDLIDYADEHKGILVAVNAEKILNANEVTLPIINGNIAYCDGSGAVLAAHQKGAPQAVKIAGCELWLKIVERFAGKRSFYIIGGKKAVNDATVERLRHDYPGIDIVGYRDGYLRTADERRALINDVAASRPDVVFVAMGSPAQEILMSEMLARHKAIYQGLGGSFDVYTGTVKRAPKWWIEHNAEFAYRLIRQPKRITRNAKFVKYAWWLLWKKF
ncbi:MAG: WecB/TagA/CpsF family glycosyltransferase [Muribaculaceae bacterium]|nr:WecB/TagA/CpsF family glycosyltransferase [Muribaculaceae bacterium]